MVFDQNSTICKAANTTQYVNNFVSSLEVLVFNAFNDK